MHAEALQGTNNCFLTESCLAKGESMGNADLALSLLPALRAAFVVAFGCPFLLGEALGKLGGMFLVCEEPVLQRAPQSCLGGSHGGYQCWSPAHKEHWRLWQGLGRRSGLLWPHAAGIPCCGSLAPVCLKNIFFCYFDTWLAAIWSAAFGWLWWNSVLIPGDMGVIFSLHCSYWCSYPPFCKLKIRLMNNVGIEHSWRSFYHCSEQKILLCAW